MLRPSILALLASTGAALAHPGHDAAVADGAAHWFTQPDHWIVLALVALVITEGARRVLRHRRRAHKDA